MSTLRSTAHIIFPIVLAVWAGAIIGVSMISTPAKFQATSLTMPVGLEVGRYTFRLFANVELGFLIAAIVSACVARPRRLSIVALAAVAIQLLLQRYWLLPDLDSRVSQILAGGPVVFTSAHWVYAAFEICKAGLLIFACYKCSSSLHNAASRWQ